MAFDLDMKVDDVAHYSMQTIASSMDELVEIVGLLKLGGDVDHLIVDCGPSVLSAADIWTAMKDTAEPRPSKIIVMSSETHEVYYA